MAELKESQPKVLPPATLLVVRGPNMGVRYELGERTRIGRDLANEISLADPGVSRLHAEIVRERFAYTIRDCGSRNGIIVNGIRVTHKQLLRNDEIQIGNTVFLFNSDLKLENAIFTQSVAVLYPGDAVTQELSAEPSAFVVPSGRDKILIEFLETLANVFSQSSLRTETFGRRLLKHLLDLFSADQAALFVRDVLTQKPRLALVLPEGGTAVIERSAIMRAFEEQRPVLACEQPESLARIPLAGHDGPLAALPEVQQGLTMMCAPLASGETTLGVLVVKKAGPNQFTAADLALLQAIARISAGFLRGAQLGDYVEIFGPRQSRPDFVPSRNPKVRALFDQAKRVAQSEASVVITGESGTGKEVLARFIHEASPRRQGPFVAVNCAAIPPTLFESELFGYERGAFTGAARTTRGKIEAADGGTLFLDEIGTLDIALQPKLLRFLQERVFYRVGGTRPIEANVRVIVATNENLEEAVNEGRFREDLWYRLNVVSFHMPPLRERREDIAPLAEHLLQQAAKRSGKTVLGLDVSALRLLERYSWPGNIRELANAIERAVILADSPLLTEKDFLFLERQIERQYSTTALANADEIIPLAEVERQHILQVLEHFDWNQARAAEALGVHRNTLRNKIIEYGLHRPDSKR
ncbi:MAG: sigma 54-interacting transcriptional regulator [Candidatus Sumerlaeaceae bacterium]